MAGEPQIWSVYNADDRLVMAISDEPGEFNFTKIPDEDVDPVDVPFATVQCYLQNAEPDLLNMLMKARDLDDFINELLSHGYKVREGRPTPAKFARL